MRLQSVLLPTEDICGIRELYFHENGEWIDFDGYFNLFQIAKRKRYTAISGLFLRLTLKGYQAIRLMCGRNCIGEYPLDSGARKDYSFPFPYGDPAMDGVFWFALRPEQSQEGGVPVHAEGDGSTEALRCLEVSGYFDGICNPLQNVSLVIDICTYRREAYVCRNLRSLKKYIFDRSDLELREHLRIYLVDNGQTLSDHAEFQTLMREYETPDMTQSVSADPPVTVFRNINAGGAGGFTRGMIEAIEHNARIESRERPYTHILLMDDDAVVEPDSLVRLYGFLTTLREEFRDIAVGGALLMEELPQLLKAEGERFFRFRVKSPDKGLDLREYRNCTTDARLTAEREEGVYSGWWFCCYPMRTVRGDNLPLPFFLHWDDIEYGLRAQKNGIVFLNGVSVWHRGIDQGPPGTNAYYDMRNSLITSVLTEKPLSRCSVFVYCLKRITGALLRRRYGSAVLRQRALRDFCRGPEWLRTTDPEQLHEEVQEENRREAETETKKEGFRNVLRCIVRAADMYGHVLWLLVFSFSKAAADYQKRAAGLRTAEFWKEYLRKKAD